MRSNVELNFSANYNKDTGYILQLRFLGFYHLVNLTVTIDTLF